MCFLGEVEVVERKEGSVVVVVHDVVEVVAEGLWRGWVVDVFDAVL